MEQSEALPEQAMSLAGRKLSDLRRKLHISCPLQLRVSLQRRPLLGPRSSAASLRPVSVEGERACSTPKDGASADDLAADASKPSKKETEADSMCSSSAASAHDAWSQEAAYSVVEKPLLSWRRFASQGNLLRLAGTTAGVLLCTRGCNSSRQIFVACCGVAIGLALAFATSECWASDHECHSQQRLGSQSRTAVVGSFALVCVVMATGLWSVEAMLHKVFQLALLAALCLTSAAISVTYLRWYKSREESKHAKAVRARSSRLTSVSTSERYPGIDWELIAECLMDNWQELAVLRCLSAEVQKAVDRTLFQRGVQGWLQWGPKPDMVEQICVSLPEVMLLPLSCCSRRRRKRSSMWLSTWSQDSHGSAPTWAACVPLGPGQLVQEEFALGSAAEGPDRGCLLKILPTPPSKAVAVQAARSPGAQWSMGYSSLGSVSPSDSLAASETSSSLSLPSSVSSSSFASSSSFTASLRPPTAASLPSQFRVVPGKTHSLTLHLLLPMAQPTAPIKYCRVGPVQLKAKDTRFHHWISSTQSSMLWVPPGAATKKGCLGARGLNLGTVQQDCDGGLLCLNLQVSALQHLLLR
mmetsp:Transcript_8027/g.17920  ORF Transcript_8027/g.17920 Transcript_8027/m.17920 type:complete len:584 (+) Transcript_8027:124-1875(+)